MIQKWKGGQELKKTSCLKSSAVYYIKDNRRQGCVSGKPRRTYLVREMTA